MTRHTTTPRALAMQQLLGSHRYGAVSLTSDEFRNLQRVYRFHEEPPVERPPAPAAPKREDFQTASDFHQAVRDHEKALERHARWKSPQALMQAGADRNTFRHAEADGLRVVAWMARFIPEGEDPLRHVIQIFAEAGFDVDPEDLAWASEP